MSQKTKVSILNINFILYCRCVGPNDEDFQPNSGQIDLGVPRLWPDFEQQASDFRSHLLQTRSAYRNQLQILPQDLLQYSLSPKAFML